MSAHIRDYTETDRSAVIQLVGAVLAEFGFVSQAEGVERELRQVGERYAGARAGFWVAEVDGEVVGTVAIRPREGVTCEVKRLYLRADRRGSGLGQALYDRAEEFARAAGYQRIWLDSSRRFAQARRLYERNGFVLLEELDNDWEDNVYAKRL